ncbi:DMT family transporter [Lysobacter enzymogenes]|uniref:DMT family transporter n=1 Tax=Lysobacter enzymogenes TaxID=69 RepID=UPI00099BE33A|nr:DMT family transporter [Lysobacter enzymogenes]UZW61096.1 DMT family transporter [Lysobacter enzymogenes]
MSSAQLTATAATPSRSLPLRAGLMAAASISLALLAVLSRYTRGLAPELVTWGRFVLPVLVLTAFARGPDWRAAWSLADRLGWLRALCAVIAQICFVFAATQGDLLQAVLLYNTGPLFIPLVAWLWLREPLRPATVAGLALGFLGVLAVLRPGGRALDPLALVALTGGVAMAVSQVLFYRCAQRQPPLRNQFKLYTQASLLSLPLALLGAVHTPWATVLGGGAASEPVWVLSLALLGMTACSLGNQSLRDLAYRGMDNASTLAPLMYVAVPVSAALDWLLFGRVAAPMALFGAALIVAGAVVALRSGAREAARVSP